ncbi:MAG: hypothetical protein GY851_07650 [bacterium]|nr:hypothetical protein [bacterium]
MNLSAEGWQRAVEFIRTRARDLERSLFAYHFEEGAFADVLSELAVCQNSDGGFGRGLEPDLRVRDSSALATTVALQHMRAVGVPADHVARRRAIEYLLNTYNADHQAWMIIPENADDAPHAPWWRYDGDYSKMMANPRAEIVGHLIESAALVPGGLIEDLTGALVDHLDGHADTLEMHEVLCYARFAASDGLPTHIRDAVLARLMDRVDAMVLRDPAQWKEYGLKPLTIAPTPDSPFAGMLAKEIEVNLDYEIEHQAEDGAFEVNFSWGDTNPEVFERVVVEWKGVFAVEMLLTLRAYGRLEAI